MRSVPPLRSRAPQGLTRGAHKPWRPRFRRSFPPLPTLCHNRPPASSPRRRSTVRTLRHPVRIRRRTPLRRSPYSSGTTPSIATRHSARLPTFCPPRAMSQMPIRSAPLELDPCPALRTTTPPCPRTTPSTHRNLALERSPAQEARPAATVSNTRNLTSLRGPRVRFAAAHVPSLSPLPGPPRSTSSRRLRLSATPAWPSRSAISRTRPSDRPSRKEPHPQTRTSSPGIFLPSAAPMTRTLPRPPPCPRACRSVSRRSSSWPPLKPATAPGSAAPAAVATAAGPPASIA